jgi:hypothetical protein
MDHPSNFKMFGRGMGLRFAKFYFLEEFRGQ